MQDENNQPPDLKETLGFMFGVITLIMVLSPIYFYFKPFFDGIMENIQAIMQPVEDLIAYLVK